MSAASINLAPAAFALLRFVRFAALDNWSASSSSGRLGYRSATSIKPLAEALQTVREPITVKDDMEYHRVTVRIHGGGVSRRDTATGKSIKTKRQFRVSAGQLIMSRIDARNGAFGLIPDDLDGAIVTNDFPTFNVIKERMLPDYLRLVVSTPQFREYCQTLSKGTTNRQRMDEATFLSIPIPFPSLQEQAKLVAKVRAAIAKAEAAEVDAEKTDQEAVRFLETSLDLEPTTAKTTFAAAKLHFTRFASLERWGSIFLGASGKKTSAKYPLVRLREVIADLQNGWSPKCHNRPAAADEWGVLKLGAVSFGVYDETANKALPASLTPTPEFELKTNDVLISRANITQYVGACVHVESTRPKLILCDKIFRVISKADSLLNGEFLAAVMKTPSVRSQIENALTGTSPTMKNISKPALLNLEFPLPPLPEQARIVAELDRLRAKARAARGIASALRASANGQFQSALFQTE